MYSAQTSSELISVGFYPKLYAGLVYCVFQKIREQYHQYLRLSTYWWRNISIMIINETSILYIEKKAFRQWFIDRKIIKIGEFVKSEPFHDNLCQEYSCFVGDKILIRHMISRDGEILDRDWHRFIHSACDGKQLEIVKFVIAKGFNDWNYGLERACDGGCLEIVQLMIDKGANSWGVGGEVPSPHFNRGLIYACSGGNLDLVHLMIEKGANDYGRGLSYCGNKDGHGHTEEHSKIARLLIQKSMEEGNRNISNWLGILMSGCSFGMLEMVQFVVENGGDAVTVINWENGFWIACMGGNLDIIRIFIEMGVNDWTSGLNGACYEGNIEIAKLMIELGANSWNRALSAVCYSICTKKHIEMAKFLIEKGADNLNQSLMQTCFMNNKYMRKSKNVLKKGSNKMHFDLTRQAELIDLLIAKGANNIEECVAHEYTSPCLKSYLQRRYLKN